MELLGGELAGVHDSRGHAAERAGLRDALPGAAVIDAGALVLACAAPANAGDVIAGMAGRVQEADALSERLGLPAEATVGEALATGYARWGSGILDRLRGPFALVVWNRLARRGFLAQDQLGGRSLFTFLDGSALIFATEISVLLRLLRRRPEPDDLAVAHHLVDHSVPDGNMLFRGIRRLGGGVMLEVSDTGRVERRHWTPRYQASLRDPRSELARQLRDELAVAVRDSLPADGVGALLLSGGLDSSVVAALAAAQQPGLQAITAAFAEPEFDETTWARRP